VNRDAHGKAVAATKETTHLTGENRRTCTPLKRTGLFPNGTVRKTITGAVDRVVKKRPHEVRGGRRRPLAAHTPAAPRQCSESGERS